MKINSGFGYCIFVLTALLSVCAAAAASTDTYQVSASADDAHAWTITDQDTTAAYLNIGDDSYSTPFYTSAYRFTSIPIPRSATITDARLKLYTADVGNKFHVYGTINAEAADNPADFSARYIASAAKSAASTAWDHTTNWTNNTTITSPDISAMIQEVVNRPGFSSGNSIALIYSTTTDSNKFRQYASFDFAPGFAPILEVTYQTHTISGFVTTAAATPIQDVIIDAGPDIESTSTDAAGYYQLLVPPAWSGTVTVSKTDWGFSPWSTDYTNVTADQPDQNYTAFQPTIAGNTGTDSVTLNGLPGTPISDASGLYSVTVTYNWTGTVTPTKTDFNISPSPRIYSNVTSDMLNEDYTAYQPTIAGNTGTGSVTLNGLPGSPISDASGLYSVAVPYGWTGTVTPTKTGFNFTPPNSSYSNITADMLNEDYTAYQPTISGYITDDTAAPIQSVTVSADNSGGSDTTDVTGYYQIIVPYDWSGTTTPTRLGWDFTPPNRTYTNVITDQTNQDFSAQNIGINVKADGTGDFPTIQDAIDASINGDHIVAEDGTYTGQGNRDINFNGKAITLRSANGPDNCIIDSQGTSSQPHRGFRFANDETNDSILDGFKIINGYGPLDSPQGIMQQYYSGGGILCKQSSPTIINCKINSNYAEYGAGFCNYSGNPVLIDCTFNYNSSSLYGGGMYNYTGSSVTNNCSFTNNFANRGGAIHGTGSDSIITDCSFTGNSASIQAGTIYNSNNSTTITNSTFTNNTTPYDAAGVYSNGCDVVITDCTFTDNSADRNGGGVYNYNSTSQITYCTFITNSAESAGAIYNRYGTNSVSNCIFSANSVIYSGGAIDNNDTNLNLNNCTFYANSGSAGGVMYNYNSTVEVANCILWANTPDQITTYLGSINVSYSNVQGGFSGTGNISIDPMLADPTNNDCHLLPGSPCINTADPNYIPAPDETDIDGDPRLVGTLDMGADEFYSPAPLIYLPTDQFNFAALQDRSNPPDQTLALSNYGIQDLSWTISSDSPWLSVTPTSGITTFAQQNLTTLSVDITGLPHGIHNGTLTITDPAAANDPLTAQVTLDITGPNLLVAPFYLEFEASTQNPVLQDQNLAITNTTTAGTLNWQVTIPPEASWLTADPLSGQSTGETDDVTVTVDHNALDIGRYTADITITDPGATNSPQTIPVSLRVYTPGQVHVPAEFDNIQEAIDYAVERDHVIVHPGTYSGQGNQDIFFRGKSITVRSIDPTDPNIVANTVIDQQNYEYSAFFFYDGEDANSILDGFTITRFGKGVINCYYSSPLIRNCIITQNGNSIGPPGGIAVDSIASSTRIENCIITQNTASIQGGNTVFFATWEGWEGGNPVIADSIISANTAIYGTGIFCYKINATIRNCTITANLATDDYGDIWFPVTSHSPGILAFNSHVTIENSIIYNNTADNPSQIGVVSDPELQGPPYPSDVTLSHSLLQGGPDQVLLIPDWYAYFEGNLDPNLIDPNTFTWGPGNIDLDPQFIADPNDGGDGWFDNLLTPQDESLNNVYGDLHLTQSSPCIDTGDPNFIPDPNDTDLDTNPRIIGPAIDMGAYEYTPTADFNADNIVDLTDLLIFAQTFAADTQSPNYNPDCDIADPKDNIIDTLDLSAFTKQWLKGIFW